VPPDVDGGERIQLTGEPGEGRAHVVLRLSPVARLPGSDRGQGLLPGRGMADPQDVGQPPGRLRQLADGDFRQLVGVLPDRPGEVLRRHLHIEDEPAHLLGIVDEPLGVLTGQLLLHQQRDRVELAHRAPQPPQPVVADRTGVLQELGGPLRHDCRVTSRRGQQPAQVRPRPLGQQHDPDERRRRGTDDRASQGT